MTDLDAAAEAYIQSLNGRYSLSTRPAFRAGWTAALQSDEVSGLVEALESIVEYESDDAIACTMIAHDALAAFKEKTK
jgi:hypothetical protein